MARQRPPSSPPPGGHPPPGGGPGGPAPGPGSSHGAGGGPRPVQSIIDTIRAEREHAAQHPRVWLWSYVCEWWDADTGMMAGDQFVEVRMSTDINQLQAANAARAVARATVPHCVETAIAAGQRLNLRCRRVGRVIGVP